MPTVLTATLVGATWFALAPPAPKSSARTPANASALASCKRLASRLGSGGGVRESDHFLLVHAQSRAWADGMSRLLEQSRDRFYATFAEAGFALAPLTRPLVWIYFDTHAQFDDYAREVDHMDLSWLDAYYSAGSNRVAIVDAPYRRKQLEQQAVARTDTPPGIRPFDAAATPIDVARVTHELAHQLAFNSGLLARGVMYPFWVSEGLAMSFEADSVAANGIRIPNQQRRSRLLEARRHHRLWSLDEFLTRVAVPADDPTAANRMYDEGWALFRFLLRRHSEELHSYLLKLAALPPGARSRQTLHREIVAAFGSPAALQPQWERYLDGLDESVVAAREADAP